MNFKLYISLTTFFLTFLQSLPFWYPANRKEYLNGTSFNDDMFPDGLFLVGFKGTLPDEQYNILLSQRHFGEKTPIDFPGFNPRGSPTGFFPFWSSDAYTYSSTMLAFAKYLKIRFWLCYCKIIHVCFFNASLLLRVDFKTNTWINTIGC